MPQDWWEPGTQSGVNAAIGGRESNLKSTKPGVNTMFLLFSTREADRIWELPLYRHFQAQLEPLLRAAIGADAMQNIVRLQMAQMTPGAHIKKHRDAGPWARMCALRQLHTAALFRRCADGCQDSTTREHETQCKTQRVSAPDTRHQPPRALQVAPRAHRGQDAPVHLVRLVSALLAAAARSGGPPFARVPRAAQRHLRRAGHLTG